VSRARFDVRVSRTRARRFHARHLGAAVDEHDWSSLDPRAYPPHLVDRARIAWTENAFNEYCTAAGLAQMQQAMLVARVPLDLLAMASGFVADELVHVELCARVARALGGGAPIDYDPAALELEVEAAAPLARAAELVVRICCVGEALSVPLLTGAMRAAAHPVTRGVLQRIVRDEAPHGAFGWLFLDWAAPRLTARELARLGRSAAATISRYETLWEPLVGGASDGVTREGFALRHVHELGWMEAGAYQALARRTIAADVIAPLARYGIDAAARRPRPRGG
jgi:hypothetical protein